MRICLKCLSKYKPQKETSVSFLEDFDPSVFWQTQSSHHAEAMGIFPISRFMSENSLKNHKY